MNLEIGKRYLTRDGLVVKIIASVADIAAADPAYPCIGVFERDGSLRRFTSNGDGNSVSNGSCMEDLVSEYVEPVKIKVPKFTYLAMDENRKWYLYAEKPCLGHSRWLHGAGAIADMVGTTLPGELLGIDWKDSLHQVAPDGTLTRVTN